MVITDRGTEVYENQIESLFLQYFEERKIDIKDSDTCKGIPQTRFLSAWKYIYNLLYKPDSSTVRYNNKNSKIDYSDIGEINSICDIYIDLCFEYNIKPSQYSFSRLTGISRDTLNSWDNGSSRGSSDAEGAGIEIKANLTHSDIVKKIKDAQQEWYKSNLSDTTVGQITLANNDEEIGLMYAKNQLMQTNLVGIPVMTSQEIHQARLERKRPEIEFADDGSVIDE